MTDLLHDIAPLTFMCGKDGKDRNASRVRDRKASSVAARCAVGRIASASTGEATHG